MHRPLERDGCAVAEPSSLPQERTGDQVARQACVHGPDRYAHPLFHERSGHAVARATGTGQLRERGGERSRDEERAERDCRTRVRGMRGGSGRARVLVDPDDDARVEPPIDAVRVRVCSSPARSSSTLGRCACSARSSPSSRSLRAAAARNVLPTPARPRGRRVRRPHAPGHALRPRPSGMRGPARSRGSRPGRASTSARPRPRPPAPRGPSCTTARSTRRSICPSGPASSTAHSSSGIPSCGCAPARSWSSSRTACRVRLQLAQRPCRDRAIYEAHAFDSTFETRPGPHGEVLVERLYSQEPPNRQRTRSDCEAIAHAGQSATGVRNRSSARRPWGSRCSSVIEPPWSSAISRTNVRPRPVPLRRSPGRSSE